MKTAYLNYLLLAGCVILFVIFILVRRRCKKNWSAVQRQGNKNEKELSHVKV
jgi:hypothetical protein